MSVLSPPPVANHPRVPESKLAAAGIQRLTIPVLETERLRFRLPTLDDFEAYVDFFTSSRADYYGGQQDRRATWRSMATMCGHWHLHGFGPFALEEKSSGRLIGHVGPWFPEGWPEPEITWALFEGSEGKGYAFEAAKTVLQFAFEKLGWTTAISAIISKNNRSIALAERLGAVNSGKKLDLRGDALDIYRHLPATEFLARFKGDVA